MSRHVDSIIECKGALILGAGIAGLFTALKLSPFPVTVLAGTRPGLSGSSAWAQGGIAAAMGADDSWESHSADTLTAGAGLCDPAIAALVAREAPARIEDLIGYGAPFDRKPDGSLALGREAAHSHHRIVHVRGDRAGAEISRTLAERALATPSITLREGFHAIELALEDGRVAGLFARTGFGPGARLVLFRAPAIIFASGGLGALYAVTTNPAAALGEGLALAALAGAEIRDPEFVQFHPTAIDVGADPAPLATEALRGEGARLVDQTGAAFMTRHHPAGDLAPRDVVARALAAEGAAGRATFLDARQAVGERFAEAFPAVFAACVAAGVDPRRDPIPVVPAAHYHMGGVATDLDGRTSLAGLLAAGECAATGVHGANRLASNSLLEAVVFGARAGAAARALADPGPSPLTARAAPELPALALAALRDRMTRDAGVVRDGAGLAELVRWLASEERAHGPALPLVTARLVAEAALARRESRGAHFRADFPRLALEAASTRRTLSCAGPRRARAA